MDVLNMSRGMLSNIFLQMFSHDHCADVVGIVGGGVGSLAAHSKCLKT
jgi:hypothetical protein